MLSLLQCWSKGVEKHPYQYFTKLQFPALVQFGLNQMTSFIDCWSWCFPNVHPYHATGLFRLKQLLNTFDSVKKGGLTNVVTFWAGLTKNGGCSWRFFLDFWAKVIARIYVFFRERRQAEILDETSHQLSTTWLLQCHLW